MNDLIARTEEPTGVHLLQWLTLRPQRQLMPATYTPPPWPAEEGFSLEAQLRLCQTPPPAEAVESRAIDNRGGTVEYLGINYIEPELNRVFGPNNWIAFSLPGHPRILSEDNAISAVDDITLDIRWANGEWQTLRGWGQMPLRANANMNTADIFRGAHSFAIRDAIRALGIHWGSGLKLLLESGLRQEVQAGDLKKDILGYVGSYLYRKELGKDIPLTIALVDELCFKYHQKTLDDLTDFKELRVMKDVLEAATFTLAQKETEYALRVRTHPELTMETPYHIMQSYKEGQDARNYARTGKAAGGPVSPARNSSSTSAGRSILPKGGPTRPH